MAECMCQSRCPAQDKRWKWRREQRKAKGDRRKFDRLHLDSCQASWRARNMQRILRHILATHNCSCLALATSHSRQLLKIEKSFFKSFFCQLNLLQHSELSSALSCANSNRARQQRLPRPRTSPLAPSSSTLFMRFLAVDIFGFSLDFPSCFSFLALLHCDYFYLQHGD